MNGLKPLEMNGLKPLEMNGLKPLEMDIPTITPQRVTWYSG
jgi:hypothetical protein